MFHQNHPIYTKSDQLFPNPFVRSLFPLFPANTKVYLVGGVIRDFLLQRECHDVDFVVVGDARRIARKVANALKAAYYTLNEDFDAGRVIYKAEGQKTILLDFAAIRGGSLEADVHLRDFTINALIMDVQDDEHQIIDLVGGAADMQAKRLRACCAQTFEQDPVRILRAVRLALGLGFTIEPQTKLWLKAAVPLLNKPSVERIRDELMRILSGNQQATALRTLQVLNVLPLLFPEVNQLKDVQQSHPHVYDGFTHTIAVIDKLALIYHWLCEGHRPQSNSSNLFLGMLDSVLGKYRPQFAIHFAADETSQNRKGSLFLAALYHDVGKSQTQSIDLQGRNHFYDHEHIGAHIAASKATALHLSNQEINDISTIVEQHMRPLSLNNTEQPLSRRAIYRFYRDAASLGVELCLLCLADFWATYDFSINQKQWEHILQVVDTLLAAWWEKKEEQVFPPPLLNGNELMQALGLKPSKVVGDLLEAIREAQVEGDVKTKEDALSFATAFLKDPS